MKTTILILLLTFFSFCCVYAQNEEMTASTGITYTSNAFNYDLLGDEMGFHLLVNQGGAITHYLLDANGDPVTLPTNFTKQFQASNAVGASIVTSGDELVVVYKDNSNSQLKVWVNSDGGKTSAWQSKTPIYSFSYSPARISSYYYDGIVHVAFDSNDDEVYYSTVVWHLFGFLI